MCYNDRVCNKKTREDFMFFEGKQDKKKNKMKITRNIISFVLAGIILFSSVGANAASASEVVVTPTAMISKGTAVSTYKANIQSGNGIRTYRVFAQVSDTYKRNSFVGRHGCAVCSLTTVLSGYSSKYKKYTPAKTYKLLEKKVFGSKRWNANYRKSLGAQRPVSLYGISKVLSYCNISNRYIRFFKDKTAVKQIENHLKTGNPVIIEVNNRKQKNGRFGSYTTKWSSSKHTMVLLGITDTGKVIVADSATRKWSGTKQRIKFTTMDELVQYMIPCKSISTSVYFKGVSSSGGYVLVNP